MEAKSAVIHEIKPNENNSKPSSTINEYGNITEDYDDEESEPLTGYLAMTIKELEAEAPNNPDIQSYLATFDKKVRAALRNTTTPSGALPFRGALTFHNLAPAFIAMPDLYDYLKECYGAIESEGDRIINNILDAANDANKCNKKKQIGVNDCREWVDNHIAESYYDDYLPGYKPVAFSIDDWYPPQPEYVPMPRKLYWWRKMPYLTWIEFKERYPEKAYEKGNI